MASRKPATRWIIAGVVLLFFIVLLVLLDRALTLDTASQWALRVGLVLLGLIAAGAVLWYLRPDEGIPLDTGDDVLLAIQAAAGRLPRGNFLNRPMVLVMGPEGSAKTTLVAQSGGQPEVLSGEAPTSPNEAPIPTATVNVWAMQQAIVTEVGGALLSDVARWSKVMRALRAPRVAAALGKGEAAPRAAVVCVPSDLFYSSNSSQQLESLGTVLRQRLAEASREMGLAMPVYVVFTRMDKIPHFEPWIGVFSKEELRVPLGATMPFDTSSNTGNYTERLSARIDVAFRQIAEIAGARRVDLIAREGVQDRRYSAYEFPRELQKVAPAVRQFLVELCRPTQLGSSPLLRGFYFVGARPVVVRDVMQAQPARTASSPIASSATQIFRESERAAAMAAVAASTVTRKVPEWVFLDRFLRDVVLADAGAASVARGGVKVQSARRAMLGVAIAASLLLLAGATVSWLGNRALSARVDDAAHAVAQLPIVQSPAGLVTFPSVEALRRLEVLRAQLDTLRTYREDGAPIWMRFGLWRGPALFEAARPVWYEGFRAQLFAAGWGAMYDSLKALPDVPGPTNDYAKSYSWLKGYLVTTNETARSSKEFLAPVLLTSWERGQTPDVDVAALSLKQFEFYSSELPSYNPWPRNADAALVKKSRAFLDRFTGGEQFYRNMLASTDKAVPPLKLKQTPGIFTVMPEVPGSFTAAGASAMANKFASNDSSDAGEKWVVGDQTTAHTVDKNALRERYATDYANMWRHVVQTANVVRPSNVKDAAVKLDAIANNTSPLLELLQTVAVNTNVDSGMRVAFQPVHAVTPPEVVGKIISDKNQPYVDGLLGLQGALVQVANLPANGDSASTAEIVKAAQAAGGDVTKARAATKRVAQAFVLTTQPSMAGPVEQLLLAPIDGAEAALRGAASLKARAPKKAVVAAPIVAAAAAAAAAPAAPAPPAVNIPAQLNARGARLCAEMTPLLAKFPFSSDATSEASIADVTNMFAPGTGKLWAFEQDNLAPYMEKTGGKWVPKAVKGVTLSPIFMEFFNRAAQITSALFSEANTTPKLQWKASAEVSATTPLITFKHGVSVSNFDVRTPKNIVDWPQPPGSSATLEATFGKNKPAPVASASGEWALFRMVAKGTSDIVGREVVVTWPATTAKNSAPVVMHFELIEPAGVPVLKRAWMGGMSCASTVAQ
jgi:type VI secretion system protein ImpL